MQQAELAIAEDSRPDNVAINYDLEASSVTVEITLPITLSGSGDVATLSAGTYLA